jgi:hypothetical protein
VLFSGLIDDLIDPTSCKVFTWKRFKWLTIWILLLCVSEALFTYLPHKDLFAYKTGIAWCLHNTNCTENSGIPEVDGGFDAFSLLLLNAIQFVLLLSPLTGYLISRKNHAS